MSLNEKGIRVISSPSKENPFVVIYKPHNLPSAPLLENEKNNALYEASLLFPEINSVKGRKEIEKGLVHRLDTVTSGLILIATDQAFYDGILEIQKENGFIKSYRAQCNVIPDTNQVLPGFPKNLNKSSDLLKCNDIVYAKSFFRGYGEGLKEVRPVTENSGFSALKKLKNKVEYETKIQILSKQREMASVVCTISKGYRHQVRCHLAWSGLPVINDPLYNPYNKEKNITEDILFEACSFEFIHPFTKEKINFSL